MGNEMKRLLFAVLMAIASGGAYAQGYVPVDTVKLNKAYRALMKDNTDANREAFFDAFPNNWMEYIATYQPIGADRKPNPQSLLMKEQVAAFGDILGSGWISPVEYCMKLVTLGVGGQLDSGASSALQKVIHEQVLILHDGIFNSLAWLKPGHQFEFWAFFWSSPYQIASLKGVRVYLQERNDKKHPQEVKIMEDAYRYFYGKTGLASEGYYR